MGGKTNNTVVQVKVCHMSFERKRGFMTRAGV